MHICICSSQSIFWEVVLIGVSVVKVVAVVGSVVDDVVVVGDVDCSIVVGVILVSVLQSS